MSRNVGFILGPVFANDPSSTHECRLMAGQRPSGPAVATSPARPHLSLLGDLERVVDLDPEASDGALKFAMTEEKLDGSQIATIQPRLPKPDTRGAATV